MVEKDELNYEELEKISGGRLDFNINHVTLHIKYSYVENGITKTRIDDVLLDYHSGRTVSQDVNYAKNYCIERGYRYISVSHTLS